MGYSFAAGTTDGPGEFGFTQGTTSNDFFWDIVRDLLAPPTEEDIECQLPKPILLATGQVKYNKFKVNFDSKLDSDSTI